MAPNSLRIYCEILPKRKQQNLNSFEKKIVFRTKTQQHSSIEIKPIDLVLELEPLEINFNNQLVNHNIRNHKDVYFRNIEKLTTQKATIIGKLYQKPHST